MAIRVRVRVRVAAHCAWLLGLGSELGLLLTVYGWVSDDGAAREIKNAIRNSGELQRAASSPPPTAA